MNSPSKILVVDRDPVLLSATRRVLETAGYETFQALSAEDAFAALREIRPNLVLLDVNPEAPGALEVCRRIKADPSLAGIYVILLSESHTDTESRAQGLELGASDYIVGPIGSRELLARVRAVLRVQQVERALQASEKRFRALVENNSDAITLLDAQGIVVYDSPAAPGMLGYSPEDWLGQDVFSLIHPDDLPKTQEIFQNLVKSPGERIRSTFRVRHKNGEWLWIELVATNLLSEPDVNAVVLNYRDITEQKQSETINTARLRLAQFSLTHSLNELLEETLNEAEKLTGSLIGFYHFVEDDQKSLTLQNWSTRTKTEFCKAEGQGLHYAIDAAGVWVDCVHQGKAVIHNDYASLSHRKGMPEGHATIIRELVVPVFRGDKISAVLGVGNKPTDYSEKDVETVSLIANLAWEIAVRKQAEEALRESEDKFKYVFEHSVLGKSITQVGGEISVNQAFCDMLGYSPDELKNRTWQEISHPDDLELTQTEINNLLSNQRESTRFIKRYLHKNGSQIWAEVGTALRRDADGKPLYFLTSINDITARKQTENALRENQANLRALLDAILESVLLIKTDGTVITVNRTTAERLNRTIQQMIGRNAYDFVSPDVAEFRKKYVDQVVAMGQPVWFEDLRNGRFVLNSISPVFGTGGQVERLAIFGFDITERKQAEEALKLSNELLSLFIQHSPIYAFIKEVTPTESRVLKASEKFEEMVGIPGSQMIGKSMQELFPPELAKTMTADDWAVASAGQVLNLEEELNGRSYTTIKFPIQLGGKHLLAGYTIDLTERKKAEEALRQSETFNRSILENSPIGISVRSQTGKLISANNAWRKIWAMSEADFLADQQKERQALNFDARDNYLSPHIDAVRRVYEQGELLHLPELKVTNPRPGAAEWIAQHFYAIQDEQGQVQQVVILTEDITERKKAEEALNESKLLFQLLIESLPQNIYAKDVNGRFVFANQRYCVTQGKTPEEIVGKTDFDLHPPLMAEKYRADDRHVIETGKPIDLEEEHQPMRGRKSIVQVIKTPFYDFKGQTAGTLGIFWDITERKQAEETLKEYNTRLESAVEARTHELRDTQEKLVRQEKLAVLGQLAGSVGHELRNPLGIINNAVYFLRLVQPDANEMIKEYLGIIETETHTADMIISDLLDFSRVKSVDLESVAVANLVGRTLERFPAPPNVQVSLKLPEDLPNAYVDPRQMTQVLGNLVLNACQAMPQGGTLTLSAKKKGKMVALSVTDTGSGITPENIKKLFEPLFTTKPKGIGLGLAVSKKLVDANGGQLEVQSEVGKGTTFTVRLPIH